MHVVLISACTRRAVKRSRAVLDSYAIRTGERSWATPITLEGLQELRGLLKTSATRQTAVACYRNDGRGRMRLLWVVGARDVFGPEGHFPAGFTRRKHQPPPLWLRVVSLLAHAGGLGHDIGKAGNFFVEKLARAVFGKGGRAEADPIRHEWISMRLIQTRRRKPEWAPAWKMIANKKPMDELDGLDCAGICSAESALDFLVATHHRLFGPLEGVSEPTSVRHIREEAVASRLSPAGELPSDILDLFERLMARLASKAGERSAAFWRGVAVCARVALILADHEVSAKRYPGLAGRVVLYANTKNGQFDQPLDWHLRSVGARAAELAWKMGCLKLSGLSCETVDHILSPADEKGRFAWQNRAVETVSALRGQADDSLLIFNVAATGAGKTIANAKLACSLSDRPRFAIALNLRTLTLQSGDSLRRDLGLGSDELAVVIGDRVALRLHESSETGRAYEGTFESEGLATEYDAEGGEVCLPGWMDSLVRERPSLKPIIGAPVLVSTIDYLVNAGEPGSQAHHAGALMRLADSDLVLDEVDAYDPEALVAVLRLVQAVGLMGRNLICSSATLPLPVAEAVYRAFRSGVEMRCAMEQKELKFSSVIVDDRIDPSVISSCEEFSAGFSGHLARLLSELRPPVRRAYVQKVPECSVGAFLDSVLTAVTRLHSDCRWDAGMGQKLSFGLVRVANIRTAIATARFLAGALPHARVACYHAREFRIQRHQKEMRLDYLLSRKRGDQHIIEDDEVRAALASSPDGGVPFIVVATPVEEVGRDHDFDWGVIEPSSAHSIVQTAGRVNRHRLQAVAQPNVAILQFNAKWVANEGDTKSCFCRPGLESGSGEFRYSSRDLGVLLEAADLDNLDARLRLGDNLMARDEDRLLDVRLKAALNVIEARTDHPSQWMTQAFYNNYRLRDQTPQIRWRCVCHDGDWRFEMQDIDPTAIKPWREMNMRQTIAVAPNAWLSWTREELLDACVAHGVSLGEGLAFECSPGDLVWDESFGFDRA